MEELILSIKTQSLSKFYNDLLNEITDFLKSDNLETHSNQEVLNKILFLFTVLINDKQFKLKNLVIDGIHLILRDKQNWKCDELMDENFIVNKVIKFVEETIQNQTESIQIEELKIFLEISCISSKAINFYHLVKIINLGSQTIEKNFKNETSLILATYTSINQIIENYILFYDESEEFSNFEFSINVQIDKNGYIKSNDNIVNEKFVDNFQRYISFVINEIEKIQVKNVLENSNDIKLLHFYLNGILAALKCFANNKDILKNLDLSFVNFFNNKLSNFIIETFDIKIIKNVFFKFDWNSKLDIEKIKKYHLDDNLFKLLFSICENILKSFSCYFCLKPNLIIIAMKMCSIKENQLCLLKTINSIFKNHKLIFEIFFLIKQNEIIADTSLLKFFLETNKKGYQSTKREIIFQSIHNINCLIESFSKILKDLNFPSYITKFKKNNLETINNNLNEKCINQFINLKDYKKELNCLLKSENNSFDTSDEENINSIDNLNKENDSKEKNKDNLDLENESKVAPGSKDENEDGITSSKKYFIKINKEVYVKKKKIISSDESYKNDTKLNKYLDAKIFYDYLKENINKFLICKNVIKIDELILKLSSDFCDQIQQHDNDKQKTLLINGDALYTSIFYSLSLSYQISQKFIPENKNQFCSIKTEQQFIDEIQNSGLTIYLSSNWIKELYQQLRLKSLLDESTFNSSNFKNLTNLPLIKLILDLGEIDILDDNNYSIAYMIDYYSFDINSKKNFKCSLDKNNFRLEIVTCLFDYIWPFLINNLSFILKNSLKFLDKTSDENTASKYDLSFINESLNFSQVLIDFLFKLNQVDKCKFIFDLFLEVILKDKQTDKKLNIIQITTIDILFKNLVPLLSKYPEVLNFFFETINLISVLEYDHFTKKLNKNQKTNFQFYNKFKDLPITMKMKSKSFKENSERLVNYEEIFNHDEYQNNNKIIQLDDKNEFIQNIDENQTDKKIVIDSYSVLIQNCLNKNSYFLSSIDYELIIIHFSKQSVQILEECALQLNLNNLMNFLKILILNSNRQLYKLSNSDKNDLNSLLFDKFCDVLIKVFKSSRPVLHLMKCWNLSLDHLIETASFKFSEKVCKKSISTINDIITSFMYNHVELNYFHFNESLFKCYEKLLLLELCELDIQEMIISSICGFVEGYSNEIGSGWKSLFNALSGLRIMNSSITKFNNTSKFDFIKLEEEIENVRQLRVLIDIFDFFLKIHKFEIFSRGALDCLICLTKLVKKNDYSSLELTNNFSLKKENQLVNLNLIALKYLSQFEFTLEEFCLNQTAFLKNDSNFMNSIYNKKIKAKLFKFENLSSIKNEIEKLSKLEKKELKNIERVYKIWYFYLENLVSLITQCSILYQSELVEIILTSLRMLLKKKNNQIGIHLTNFIVFSFLQNWSVVVNLNLNQENSIIEKIDTQNKFQINRLEFSNFKHFCITFSHLIVRHLNLFDERQLWSDNFKLTLYQFYTLFGLVLNDSYHLSISTLSLSCFKHVLNESFKVIDREENFIFLFQLIKIINDEYLGFFKNLLTYFGNENQNFVNLNLINQSLGEYENVLYLDIDYNYKLCCQFLLQSYIKSNIELSDSNITKKLYSFEMDEKIYTIDLIIKKFMFLDLILKEIGTLLYFSFKSQYDLKNFLDIENNMNNFSQICFVESKVILELINDISLILEQLEKNLTVKFLFQKVSMLKLPINFYQPNAVCFFLKFLYHFDFLINNKLEDEFLLVEKISILTKNLIIKYITFKVERELMQQNISENFSNFIFSIEENHELKTKQNFDLNNLNGKLELLKSLLVKKINFTELKTDLIKELNYKKESSYNVLDTECFLVIWHKIIKTIIYLHLNTDYKIFTKTLPCFTEMISLLLMVKNFDEVNLWIYDWLMNLKVTNVN